MLILYNKNALPNDKEDIKFPWDTYFEDNEITNYLDETDEKIVEDVEKTSIINSNTIHGKLSNMGIAIGCLSDGCKTLLCINHAIKNNTADKYLFNITDCGGNAISYLASTIAKDKDVHAYIEQYDFGVSTDCHIKIDNTAFNDAIDTSSALLKLQEYLDDEED